MHNITNTNLAHKMLRVNACYMSEQGKMEAVGKKKKEAAGILADGEKMLDEANALSDNVNRGKEVHFTLETQYKCYNGNNETNK